LRGIVLEGAARDQLLEGRHLVGLLEFGSNEESTDPYQLQLAGRYSLYSEVLVDQGNDGEEGFREHLELLMQF